jgi:hypothetical protein
VLSYIVTVMNTYPGDIWNEVDIVCFMVGLPLSICLKGLRVKRASFVSTAVFCPGLAPDVSLI